MFDDLVWRVVRKRLVANRKMSRTHRKRKGVKRVVCAFQNLPKPFKSANDFVDRLLEEIRDDLVFADLLVLPRLAGNLLYGVWPVLNKRKIDEIYERLKTPYLNLLKYISKELSISIVAAGVEDFKKPPEVYVLKDGCLIYKRDLSGDEQPTAVFLDDWTIAILRREETFSFEKMRPLVEKGVYTFILLDLEEEDKNWWIEKTGLWARSQSLEVFGVKASPFGQFLDRTFKGKSYVSAPVPLTPSLNGFLTKTDERNSKVSVDLDLELLSRKRHENYKRFVSLFKET